MEERGCEAGADEFTDQAILIKIATYNILNTKGINLFLNFMKIDMMSVSGFWKETYMSLTQTLLAFKKLYLAPNSWMSW